MDGNEIDDQSARNTSSHPLVGPPPDFGIPTEGAWGSNQGLDTHNTITKSHIWTMAKEMENYSI